MKKTMTLALAAAFAGAVFAQPENDDFTNAVQLAGTSGSVTCFNQGATREPHDPISMSDEKYGATVWYLWTAPSDGRLRLDTRGSHRTRSAEPLDTVLSIGDPHPYYPTSYSLNDDDGTLRDGTSFIDCAVLAQQTYLIGIGTKWIANYSGVDYYAEGDVVLNYSFSPEVARVIFNSQGGTIQNGSISLADGYTLEQCGNVPVPVRGGYDFLGWFTEPEGGIEVNAEDTLYDELAACVVDGYLHLYAHWKMTGLEEPQFGSFDRSQKFMGILLNKGAVRGSIEITASKRNSKNVSRLSVKITRFDTGKRIGAKGTLTFAADGSATSDGIHISFKDGVWEDDTMYLTMKPDGRFTMSGRVYDVEATQIGGALTYQTMTLSVPELTWPSGKPSVPAGYRLITAVLPTNFTFSLASSGRKFSFPKSTPLKYVADKPVRRPAATVASNVPGRQLRQYRLAGLDSENPACLKLTYQYRTGLFKGSFVFYASNGDDVVLGKKPLLKKYTVKVVGLVMDRRGWGMATSAATGQKWFVFLNP